MPMTVCMPKGNTLFASVNQDVCKCGAVAVLNGGEGMCVAAADKRFGANCVLQMCFFCINWSPTPSGLDCVYIQFADIALQIGVP